MSELVKYGSFSLEAAKTASDEVKKYRTVDVVRKLSEGTTVVRLLPPRLGESQPWVLVPEHLFQTADGAWVSFPCPRMLAKQPCPLCARARQMKAGGNPIDSKRAEKLEPSPVAYANAVFRDTEHDGPKVWQFKTMILNKLTLVRQGTGRDFTHPVNGCDLAIIRSGTGQMDTRYEVMARDPGPLHKDGKVMNEWLSSMTNLNKYKFVPSVQDIQDLMSGRKKFLIPSEQRPAPSVEDGYAQGEVVEDDGDF